MSQPQTILDDRLVRGYRDGYFHKEARTPIADPVEQAKRDAERNDKGVYGRLTSGEPESVEALNENRELEFNKEKPWNPEHIKALQSYGSELDPKTGRITEIPEDKRDITRLKPLWKGALPFGYGDETTQGLRNYADNVDAKYSRWYSKYLHPVDYRTEVPTAVGARKAADKLESYRPWVMGGGIALAVPLLALLLRGGMGAYKSMTAPAQSARDPAQEASEAWARYYRGRGY